MFSMKEEQISDPTRQLWWVVRVAAASRTGSVSIPWNLSWINLSEASIAVPSTGWMNHCRHHFASALDLEQLLYASPTSERNECRWCPGLCLNASSNVDRVASLSWTLEIEAYLANSFHNIQQQMHKRKEYKACKFPTIIPSPSLHLCSRVSNFCSML